MLPDFSSICIKCLIWVAQSQISGQWLDSLSYLLRIFKVPWGSNFWFVIFCFALLDNAKPRCWTWQKLPATTAHCSCTLSILKRAVPKTILGASKLQWQVPTNIQSFWGIEELNFLLFISLLTLCHCRRRCVGFPFKSRNNPKHSNTDLNVVCHGNG